MIVALNSDQAYYLYLFWLDPWPWPFLFFSFGMNSSILAFCVGLCLLCVRKLVMFPAPKSNGFMKKRPYAVQGLPLQEVSLVYAACTLLLCFGCSFPQVSPLQSFSLPAAESVQTSARVWWVLMRCALVCLLVKRDLMLFPLDLKLCRTLSAVDLVHAGGLCWSSGGEAHYSGS